KPAKAGFFVPADAAHDGDRRRRGHRATAPTVRTPALPGGAGPSLFPAPAPAGVGRVRGLTEALYAPCLADLSGKSSAPPRAKPGQPRWTDGDRTSSPARYT